MRKTLTWVVLCGTIYVMIESGIYQIYNTVNGKYYIGSTDNFVDRWKRHKSCIRHGIHPSKHLMYAWKKYGESTFEFRIIEYIENLDDLIPVEQYYLDYMEATNPEYGYNYCKVAGSTRGMNLSDEHKKKISNGLKGIFAGIKNPKAVLDQGRVDEMRIIYASTDISISQLAKKFNVSFGAAEDVLHNRNWKNPNYCFNSENAKRKTDKLKGEGNPAAKLLRNQAKEIRIRYATTNISMRQLAKMFKVSLASIKLILDNRNWPDPDYIYVPRKKK
jgi:group I intron endonuclease